MKKHTLIASSLALSGALFLNASAFADGQKQPADTAPPETATAVDFINAFEKLSGAHPGFRKAHAKGVCVQATFSPNTDSPFAGSPLFSNGDLPASIRFSVGGGNPVSDERTPGVRGMGTQIKLPGGGMHTFTGNSTPVFAAKDPETFLGLLQRLMPDESGRPNMARLGAYIAANPSTQAGAMWSRTTPAPASYANTPYFGLHTFFYQADDAQEQVKFRWHIEPSLGNKGLDAEASATLPALFLEDTLKEQVANEETPVTFTIIATLGEENDTNIDPSVQWPKERPQVNMGTLTLNSVGTQSCDKTNYDPNLLSSGFTPSDDPVLRMRSPAYGISFGKRLSGQ
ncbi:catalase family peroxidase [Glaciecola petra]|uniref:Catalase-related peroxidase n=1 Tax=Glaciecola petra TaxID=3075602 RepID=A0ABU2ZTD1_9ALTE|nr:catalase family peroxidase [Aestuariibacter sp. P117]MDT0595893.1 catalase family peroxidase [Aestuariibacter sp. P117]